MRGRTWARSLAVWAPSPPWHSVQVSWTVSCIGSIPAWHDSHEALEGGAGGLAAGVLAGGASAAGAVWIAAPANAPATTSRTAAIRVIAF